MQKLSTLGIKTATFTEFGYEIGGASGGYITIYQRIAFTSLLPTNVNPITPVCNDRYPLM